MKTLRPLLLFVALLLVIGMACSALSGGGGDTTHATPNRSSPAPLPYHNRSSLDLKPLHLRKNPHNLPHNNTSPKNLISTFQDWSILTVAERQSGPGQGYRRCQDWTTV